MKERNQTEEYRITRQPYIRVFAYRSKINERLIVRMYVNVPGFYGIGYDLSIKSWKEERRFWGNLVGYEKTDADVTNFFYQLKPIIL